MKNQLEHIRQSFIGEIIALLAGGLLTLASAPFDIWPLALVSLMILFWVWLPVNGTRAFWRGFIFGVGFFGTSVYWVYISVYVYGHTPMWFAFIVIAVFVSILSLFPATVAALSHWYLPHARNLRLLCLYPCIWVFFGEWTRSWLFSGFPWAFIGYAGLHTPLKGYAPFLSVYGISLALAFSASLLLFAWIKASIQEYKLAWISVIWVGIIFAIGGLLSLIHWSTPIGNPIALHLIQANIPQDLRWEAGEATAIVNKYLKMSEPYWGPKVSVPTAGTVGDINNIIIWPEAAIPIPLPASMDILLQLVDKATAHHTILMTGIPIVLPQVNGYLNTMIALGSDKKWVVYAKHILVPFGEYMPFPAIAKHVTDYFNMPMSDFVPNPKPFAPVEINNLSIATFICYEIAYPEAVRFDAPKSNLLLTISNDAWFGHSIAEAQHLQIAAMRSLETSRPGIVVSNTGLTAIINTQGNIDSVAPPYQTTVLNGTVRAVQGNTPWVKYGTNALFILFLVMLAIPIRTAYLQR